MTIRSSLTIAVVLGMLAGAAQAESEARQGADWVRISALPCKNEQVLAIIAAAGEDPSDYRAARAEFANAQYSPCWRPLFERRQVHVRYEDGDEGLIDFNDFKPVQTI